MPSNTTIDLHDLAEHAGLAGALAAATEDTLYELRRRLREELDQRHMLALHQGLREALGWMYDGADPGGLRITAVEFTTTEWDDGHWWHPEAATVVLSDGSRLTEDLSEHLDETLCLLASTAQPQEGDVLTVAVPG
ncbi:hypothetical protein F7Q99_36230 [Streptomyces kaniharaensis]|uniref:Uncharacterized protein n=1 Tax=Streptomyces kaniharaensis TaxID=212423 RepID=A0A6N7L1G3_9ACTN|nr:hypothetical protein [Streptomyces kaniharaensis]MQS17491.1 hypothetical protein [Streptomyces kaniharaensis]